MVKYDRLLDDIGSRTGLGAGEARAAAEVTVTALAHVLDESQRAVLLAELPAELAKDTSGETAQDPSEPADFVQRLALLGRRPPEEARYRAQAVLSSIAGQDPELVEQLDLPEDVRALTRPLDAGGGVTGPTGHQPRLTDEELRQELERLPQWSGDTDGISRVLELPPENLDAVLDRLDGLRRRSGRGPDIDRKGGTAVLTLRTKAVGGVTRLDVDLAHRVDEEIQRAGAGI
ncbi:Pterin-4a-carbinolamine dehydratase [Saccharopolyspora kobensis]|uniref:Putative pterin-4-alpha-carbinolamine dehydratase n=1 Tax=Saccharopolyspora kobensis TaxID=146035 RepID=A0A1H5VKH1_9PSEU|nr:DUF2267 domain-containing protein [Saccharopolyspora kobensis]SEF87832.1 Pterin-4a-carbinolamine dehydratase [Saccharopolyspora kobensis]SFC59822.1 Pterin-4a-carbinolamine dehydratase [Saccharopolyspora kobensis]